MIRFDGVSKRYPHGELALQDVSFSLEPGEMAFVTGHSGAGKSTLLKLLIMAERPSNGTVLFDGINLGRLPRRRVPALRRRIGMVFQDHHLLLDRSVADNVALPLVIAGMPRNERLKRTRAALQKVGLGEYGHKQPRHLSTGQQQRVGIARAIVARPDVLIADEPTGNLDPELSRTIMEIFVGFSQIGTSVLIATHDLMLLKQLRQRTIVLDQGRLIDDIPSTELA